MYLNDDTYKDEDKVFLTIPFYNPLIKKIVTGIAITVVIMIAIHRIGFGYHHFGDVLIGGILGAIIGYVSYSSFNLARKHCISTQDENKEMNINPWINRFIQVVFIFICALAIYDFFSNKFVKLAELKH
jgi:membrane-associated phospholipid phosphatase